MNCSTFYDLAEHGFGQWWLLILALGLAALGALLFGVGKVFSHKQSILGWIGYLTFRVGGAGFAVGWLIFGVLQTYQGYVLYRDLLHAQEAGRQKHIEGVITNFSPYGSRPSPDPKESFAVDGITFVYSPSEILPGFNQAQGEGSPIHNGALVRVGYVDGTIVRLEICQANAQ